MCQTIFVLCEELYVCSFKQNFFKSESRSPNEVVEDITLELNLNCSEDEITKLTATYTSLGEFFETQLDDFGNESFFNYFDLILSSDKNMFELLHRNFFTNVLENMRHHDKTCYKLEHFMKIGCVALLGDRLLKININKKFPEPFSQIVLVDILEKQEMISSKK